MEKIKKDIKMLVDIDVKVRVRVFMNKFVKNNKKVSRYVENVMNFVIIVYSYT